MSKPDLETIPPWATSTQEPPAERLLEDATTDVCIVGAGMAGLSAAYELLQAGRSVVVLERHAIGRGETFRSTAQLVTALERRYLDLERIHGSQGAALAAESHAAAITRIESIAARESIACGFERLGGYLFAGPEHDEGLLHREADAARRAGLHDVVLRSVSPAPSLTRGPCLHFPHQAQLDPVAYVAGLADAVRRLGGKIYTHAAVGEIASGPPFRVATVDGPTVTAAQVVVATNSPINNRVAIHTKQGAYRTYVIAAPLPAPDWEGALPLGLYWDTSDPYHYVRLARDGARSWLLVGGEDHKTGQAHHPEERWSRLETWMRERVPEAGPVSARWSGQVMEAADGLGFIGRNPLDREGSFVITGDSGIGMTHGALAGMMLADLLTGKDNRWAALYDPARVSLRAGLELVHEAATAVQPYTDWLESGDVADEAQIAPGEGAVVRVGLRLHALYRDETSVLHRCSAVCPHLGGVVRWNRAERSWDCPCHGSRFDAYGRIMHGPANSDLAKVEEEQPGENVGELVVGS